MRSKTLHTCLVLCGLLTACGPSDQELAESLVLEGSSWQLVRINSLNDFTWVPDDPGKYVIRFRDENRLEGTSDCNRLGATWRKDGLLLTLEQFVTSRAMCPPGTLHNHFVSNLSSVTGYSVVEGNLRLETSVDGVYLLLEPSSSL